MKKGQFDQPFIIIFAMIVAIMILIFGFKVILDLKERGDFTLLGDNVADLRDFARTYYNLEQDSAREIELRVPGSINCFCFKDLTGPTSFSASIPSSYDEVICGEEWSVLRERMNSGQLRNNLFVTPSSAFSTTSFWIIEPTTLLVPLSENPLCIPIQNSKFKAVIENKGAYVEIRAL